MLGTEIEASSINRTNFASKKRSQNKDVKNSWRKTYTIKGGSIRPKMKPYISIQNFEMCSGLTIK